MRTLLPLCIAWFALAAGAQEVGDPDRAAPDAEERAEISAELFYEILLGELLASQGALDDAQALVMEAARTSGHEQAYRRAVELALQSRSGDQALANARAWLAAFPHSRDANRFVLQILLHLGRAKETARHLAQELAHTPEDEKAGFLLLLPQIYARVADRKAAARVLEQTLAQAQVLEHPRHAPWAWVALGQARLDSGEQAPALAAARRARRAAAAAGAGAEATDAGEQTPALEEALYRLWLQLFRGGVEEAEADIEQHLARHPSLENGLRYATVLVERQRQRDARRQLIILTARFAQAHEVWVALAGLQLQMGEATQARASVERLAAVLDAVEPQQYAGALAQYHLLRAQVAEKQGHLNQAERLLRDMEENTPPEVAPLLFLRTQRAALLARRGQMRQALALIRSVPAHDAKQARLKQLAEVDLLRNAGQLKQAHALQSRLHREEPQDTALAYDLALLAERMGRHGEMERILRAIIDRHPDHHHAHNALGYSFAERGIRLQEAEALIRRALELAPGNPYITDSLAWVKFRHGDLAGARELLEQAWRQQPDVEIGAHLGEVLWRLDERVRAKEIWQRVRAADPDNQTLRETLRRLGVAL